MKTEKLSRRDALLRTAAAGGTLAFGSSLPGFSRHGEASAASNATQPGYRFPKDFLWGAGTSGLQHEGSPLAVGAGASSMYHWAHAGARQKVAKPDWFTPPIDTFDTSADFYRRYRSDIQLMRQLNFNAYNFEVYWPRILPEGTGRVNEKGLAFYDALVDELLKAGIAPLCNLYVFDHPAALQDRGGWLNRDMADWFADYGRILFERLGDRVELWTPICELPIITAFTSGAVVPAPKEAGSARLRATHHLLLGQGRVAQAFRASGIKGRIGNQHNLHIHVPASGSEADMAAAARARAASDLLYLDSQLRGEYPSELIEWLGKNWPADAILEGDLKIISTPIDFLGINYGTRSSVRYDATQAGGPLQTSSVDWQGSAPYERTASDVRDSLLWLRERYGSRPIYILECGEGLTDTVVNGQVNDSARVKYMQEYVRGLHEALSQGIDLRGCFVWSFLDGWEFGYGLSLRYGLVHVDFETQQRIVKASGRWYGELIAGQRRVARP